MKGLPVAFLCICQLVVAFDGNAQEAEPSYPKELSRWKEMTPPPAAKGTERDKWFMKANRSELEWRVFLSDQGEPCAELIPFGKMHVMPGPGFLPKTGRWHPKTRKTYLRVDDGWLAGLNQGECGGELHWFSADGSQNYKIADLHVVNFATNAKGIFLVEGLDPGLVESTIVKVSRPGKGKRWEALTVATLPAMPCALAVRKDGTLVVTLSEGLVTMSPDGPVSQVSGRHSWTFYPTSSVLSKDESLLYIGMKQYVVELNLKFHSIRYLLPDEKLLNRDSGL